jgi:hypothetical protein
VSEGSLVVSVVSGVSDVDVECVSIGGFGGKAGGMEVSLLGGGRSCLGVSKRGVQSVLKDAAGGDGLSASAGCGGCTLRRFSATSSDFRRTLSLLMVAFHFKIYIYVRDLTGVLLL